MGTQEQHPNSNPNPDPNGKAIGGQEQQYLVTAAQAQITRDSALGIGHGEEAEEEGQQEHKAEEPPVKQEEPADLASAQLDQAPDL